MEMFNKRISQNILMVFIINVLLIALANTANAQNFQNGDLNGVINGASSLPFYWQNVPNTDVNCWADDPDRATPDLTDINGPNTITGIAGIAFSGNTFVSGLHSNLSLYFHEGIQQTVAGFNVGSTYTLNFYQANIKQNPAQDTSGGWSVYMNGNLAYISQPSINLNSPTDVNHVWDKRSFIFTATSSDILFQFLPRDDDSDIKHGVRMGIDSIYIKKLNPCTNHMLSITLKENNVECFGDSTGSILSNVSGGTAPYTYSWDNGGSTPNISGLVSGTYSLTVTDDNGCVQSSSIQLNQSPQIVVSEDVNDVLCYGLNSGSIELVVSGGSPTYTYAWDNGSSSSLINNLYSGTYIYTVTDKLGCEHDDTINVLEPSDISITLSSTDVLCNGGSNGEISSTISGGVTPYVFSWNNGYVTPSISALSVGVYSLTVSDSNGCQKSGSVIINEPAELILDLDTVNVLCFGDSSGAIHSNVNGGTPSYSYSWSNGYSSSSINNLIVGSYTLVVTDGNGCSNTAIAEVTEEDEIIIAATIDGVLCENEDIGAIDISVAGGTSPYEYSWSNNALTEDISNLAPGVYDLNVKDLNNCIKNESFVINAPPPFNIDLNPDTFVCEGEKVVLTAQGGVSYQWSNGNAGSSMQITANQTASYTVTVTSINGCVSEATSIVGAWSNPVAEAGEDTTIYVGMSTTLNGSGGLSFSWTPEDYLDCPDCPNPISTPEIDMEYVLWVTDENGCISSDTVWVFVNSKTNLYVPNAFSPDNDGFNDEFKVYGNNIEALNLVVYDRWGEIVFQSNSQQIGWDGTFKGEALNNATFVYLLKVRTAEGEDIIQKGDINLLK